jgi:hypothetical protein
MSDNTNIPTQDDENDDDIIFVDEVKRGGMGKFLALISSLEWLTNILF